MDKKRIIAIVLIVLAVAMAVVSYLLLPDKVIVQVSFSGNASNVMSKPLAVLLPLALSVLGSVVYITSDKKGYLIVAIAGVLLPVLTLIFNGVIKF